MEKIMNNERPGLKELLRQARSGGYAIGAFNITCYLTCRAAIAAANETAAPILLQTSVGTVKKFGTEELFAMMELLRRGARVPVLFHLDHCTDPELAKKCVDAGWDSVMIDMSARPLEENIRITAEIKKYAQNKGAGVEGELGIIKGVEEEIAADEQQLAGYEDSIKFIDGTDVDAFAPAIGTAHGLYKKEVNLNYDLVKRLADSAAVPIVVHGGTGLTTEQFHALIRGGASKINVSTALKYAYIDGLRGYWEDHRDEYNPIKLNNAAESSVQKVVADHILRFKPPR
jgi:fructose-bisphosphate aldolase class II